MEPLIFNCLDGLQMCFCRPSRRGVWKGDPVQSSDALQLEQNLQLRSAPLEAKGLEAVASPPLPAQPKLQVSCRRFQTTVFSVPISLSCRLTLEDQSGPHPPGHEVREAAPSLPPSTAEFSQPRASSMLGKLGPGARTAYENAAPKRRPRRTIHPRARVSEKVGGARWRDRRRVFPDLHVVDDPANLHLDGGEQLV